MDIILNIIYILFRYDSNIISRSLGVAVVKAV